MNAVKSVTILHVRGSAVNTAVLDRMSKDGWVAVAAVRRIVRSRMGSLC
jgi:hypothetical protein